MKLKFNLLYFFDKSGSVFNTVKFLNKHIKNLEIVDSYELSTGEWIFGQEKKPKIIKHHIGQLKDEGKISIIIDGIMYKQERLEEWRNNFIIYVFIHNMTREEVDSELESLKKERDELIFKKKDIDPFGEENWIDERIVTKFKKFV
jgi:hypothetical protein